jgi:(2R)-sulfolactate sulfo-lyase subunit alpha
LAWLKLFLCRVAHNRFQPDAFQVDGSLRGVAMIHFVLHEAKDTVAVAVVEGIKAGAELTAWIMDDDKQIKIKALQDIPIGHKIALKDMAVGETIFKYGTDIGKVVAPIKAGEHAHVHNIKTKRW